jgi:hypothetical protein
MGEGGYGETVGVPVGHQPQLLGELLVVEDDPLTFCCGDPGAGVGDVDDERRQTGPGSEDLPRRARSLSGRAVGLEFRGRHTI